MHRKNWKTMADPGCEIVASLHVCVFASVYFLIFL